VDMVFDSDRAHHGVRVGRYWEPVDALVPRARRREDRTARRGRVAERLGFSARGEQRETDDGDEGDPHTRSIGVRVKVALPRSRQAIVMW
jgi:hypothetical protein